jgi:glycosyltransferase involved in cell wall biosynthesis
LKISLITVTFNAADTIELCINSVINQQYPHLEYIIIDAQSTDGTLVIANKYKKHIHHIVSGPDNGIYDAMNKGIKHATGDIIGILNADDHFAGNDILKTINNIFEITGADAVYGNVDYIDRNGKVVRRWRSGVYEHGAFNRGWMPPHPSFYVKKQLFEKFGLYDLQYGSATDYELMLRFIHTHKIEVHYLNKVVVKMLIGGVSNKNIKNRINAWKNDYKAMRTNGLPFPYIAIVLKPLRKITQYINIK